VVFKRLGSIAWYSGELYHSLALAMLSNSIATTALGDPITVHNFDVAPSTQKLAAEFFQAVACQVLVFSKTRWVANAIY